VVFKHTFLQSTPQKAAAKVIQIVEYLITYQEKQSTLTILFSDIEPALLQTAYGTF
jgi:hypothetical protein